ncbi:hypothetical protein ABW54_18180 [Burkholderia cenocepacia]|nr:hypothetical protein ABW54_18180 [Burkholderia cenocepacia]
MAVDAAEIHVLLAPSGCGKTTTLQMINRLVRPASGRIYLEGRDTGFEVVACEPDIRAARRRLVADVGRRRGDRDGATKSPIGKIGKARPGNATSGASAIKKLNKRVNCARFGKSCRSKP